MQKTSLTRTEFLGTVGKMAVGVCACAATSGIVQALAADAPPDSTTAAPSAPNRAEERMKFAEGWVTRFFRELDANIPEDLRKKLMIANGCACHRAWIASEGIKIRKHTFEDWAEWIKKHPNDTVQVEGNIIRYQFTSSAETGLPSAEGQCLCSFVESKPVGLSPTYCYCSVGYVKEMHEQIFDKPVDVELEESVLQGGQRCRFKITVS